MLHFLHTKTCVVFFFNFFNFFYIWYEFYFQEKLISFYFRI